MSWMKWGSGEKVNVRHDAVLQVQILEEVGTRWVPVRTELVPARDLGGAFTVESYCRPWQTTRRRRMRWRPRVEDVLEPGQPCSCPDCVKRYGAA